MNLNVWPVGFVPGRIARVFMNVNHKLVSDGYDTWKQEVRRESPAVKAKLVTSISRHNRGKHVPVLDIDIPAYLVPSSTQDHSHLYLDVEMSWWRYKRLLKQMAKAGILEKGYVKASLARKHTAVRCPWITKDDV